MLFRSSPAVIAPVLAPTMAQVIAPVLAKVVARALVTLVMATGAQAASTDLTSSPTSLDPRLINQAKYELTYPLDPLGEASAAYQTECYDKDEMASGSLVLEYVTQIDPLRCFRATHDDVDLEPKDNHLPTIGFIGLPWLEWVGGDIDLRGGTGGRTFDEFKMSRLRHIGGRLSLDFNPAFEGMALPELLSTSEVDIELRTADLDLTGLDALQLITGRLHFHNPNDASPPYFRGMNGLTEAGSLKVTGTGALFEPAGPGLSQLALVRGNVSISITAPSAQPTGYRAIYATQGIETICGDLTISGDASNVNPAQDFPSLMYVAGSISIGGVNASSQFSGVSVGGNPAACQ